MHASYQSDHIELSIELSGAARNFLASFQNKILDTIREQSEKYRVGIFYHEISTDASVTTNNNENDSDQDENQSEDDEDDDSKSSSSRASSTAKSACGDARRSHP
ncbi:unnamed protein product [Rotaria sordida]|uniref:Uncharacterized protein n=1 Tax=Rotaria sordida TaxID=392033 RepID=A0A820CJ38_9BILA|nr:unnamed protein product [Rotaria sordida]CAF4221989.1 unnamed protein product [Rotaria sordida]